MLAFTLALTDADKRLRKYSYLGRNRRCILGAASIKSRPALSQWSGKINQSALTAPEEISSGKLSLVL